ncbi:inositol-3-phosphate synthase [Myxococcota bacterium]|nr:inositol-3-phosphate synthase [Myxococcota bacterium]MBU1432850.1 inositol-3-phosphate synthase [Myxococcota bacterium]MBU1897534.1 inositol-3-phosphate synthase [Myxococcota bacterium]
MTVQQAAPRLGILLQGIGAVGSTVIAGAIAVNKGLGLPIGSLTQLGHIRLGKRTEGRSPLIKDFVPLTPMSGLVFGGWDIFGGDVYEACKTAKVLDGNLIEALADDLKAIKAMPGAFDPDYVKRLNGTHIKAGTRRDWAEALREDIRRFKADNDLERCVIVNCSSTEVYNELSDVHQDLAAFEAGLDANDARISPTMIYTYAALMEGVPYANGTPSWAGDLPALQTLAIERGVPVSGKDFKTGQTMLKTVLAPMFKARMLGVKGWFSTNILGNRDGEVLDDPGSFKSKEKTKLGVIDSILQPKLYPDLYGDLYHKVRINYYPPRGDSKEGWDNIDIFGWLGYPMQIKVDFLCRDSILAAPIALDLALFSDLAARAGRRGTQEWLSFYWKSPMTAPEVYAEHDLFIQLTKLKNNLRHMMGETLITHLGTEYYEQ